MSSSYAPVRGSFTRPRPAAADGFAFTGRLAGHALKPGCYQLVATPPPTAAPARPPALTFRIIK